MCILAKTDRLDARVVARFAQATGVEAKPLPTAEARELQELVVRRAQLVEQRARERMRLKQAGGTAAVARTIEPMLELLTRLIEDVDAELALRVKGSALWREKERLLRSAPGVGSTLAVTLLARLPELGTMSGKEAAALVGVASLARDSGKMRLPRACWGGRKALRQALVARERKLLTMLNAMLMRGVEVGARLTLDTQHSCSPAKRERGQNPSMRDPERVT